MQCFKLHLHIYFHAQVLLVHAQIQYTLSNAFKAAHAFTGAEFPE